MDTWPTTVKRAQSTGIGSHTASTDVVELAFRAQRTCSEPACDRNSAFMALLEAYRGSGGLARTPEVIGWLRRRNAGMVDALACWVRSREVISLDWQDETWLPWFQFDHEAGQRSPYVTEIVGELRRVMDDWTLARWFAYPHARLGDLSPAEVLPCRPAEVLAAARAGLYPAVT